MTPFCDNKLCRLHSVEIQGPQFDVVTYIEANGKEVRSRRFIIADPERKQTWAFCESCAHAVAMVNDRR